MLNSVTGPWQENGFARFLSAYETSFNQNISVDTYTKTLVITCNSDINSRKFI